MRKALVGAIVTMGGVWSEAEGAVNVFDIASNPAVSISTSAHPSGATNVDITLLGTATTDGVVFIETTNNEALGVVTLRNQKNDFDLVVSIRGAGGDFSKRPASIIEIIGGSGVQNLGNIVLDPCEVMGSIGLIDGINRIEELDMENGTAMARIVLDSASGTNSVPPSFINSEIRGDVLILTLTTNGLIDGLVIDGSLGSRSGDELGFLTVDNIGTIRMDAAYGFIQGYTNDFVKGLHQLIIGDTSIPGPAYHGIISVDAIEAVGATPGTIRVADGIDEGSIIRIKEALKIGEGQIELPAGGLAGQIVIGTVEDAGEWTGEVFLGATVLGDGYSQTSGALGGGMAGTVPFKTHLTDSSPVFGSNLAFTTGATAPTYDIRHYGRIHFDPLVSAPQPVRIQRRARCIGSTWLDVTDVWQFEYEAPQDPAVFGYPVSVLTMTATVAGHYRNGFEYRFSNEKEGDDRLMCFVGFTATQVNVDSYPGGAWFTVGSECPWDTNGDSFVGVDDLNAVLGDWQETGTNLYGDIDGDGAVEVSDLNHVLTHWQESGCVGCSQSFMMMGGLAFGGAESLMEELGYDSVESFCAEVAAAEGEEQSALLTALGVAASE